MRPRCLIAPLVVLVLSALPAFAVAAPTLPLDHAGRWLTDASGRVVVTHGINMVAKRPPYAPDAIGFGDDDAAFLAAEGYNSVRVGVIYTAVEPQPGVYDDAYLDRIAATVATLGRHGIVSVLDFHQDLFNERFGGEGFPDWAVQDDGLPTQPSFGFPANYLLMPSLERAFDHFWANDPGPGGVGLQDRYAAAWAHVAKRFAGDKNVLGYELLNEPWPGTVWQPCVNPVSGCPGFDATLTAFNRKMAAAIRGVDPRTLILYEPNVLFNNGPPSAVGALNDPHAVFSFHDYCLTAGQPQCTTFDDLVFANAAKHSASTGAALLMTEFGATDDQPVLRDMVARADRDMVSWQEWHYCGCDDPTTSGPGAKQAIVLDPAKPPAGANLKTATLDSLTRPYPQVVAGTPRSYGFAAAGGTFTLRYATARAGGGAPFPAGSVTEIAVPQRQYPDGYAAAVDGGAVVSPPGATTLRVASCPGADSVTVTVTRSGGARSSCTVAGARLRVTVTPRAVRAGARVTLHVRVRTATGPAAGARVRLGRLRAVADAAGRATLRVRFAGPGRRTVRATAPGAQAGRATVVVRTRQK